MFQKIITLLSGIAIVVGVYLTIDSIYQPAPMDSQDNLTEQEIPEEFYEISRKDISKKTSLNGTVDVTSKESQTLSFQKSGQIQNIFVQVGESVNRGDVIVLLEAEDVLAERQVAKQAVDQAQANLINAINNPQVTEKTVYDQGIVNQAQANLNNIRNQVEQNISLADQQVQNHLQELEDIESDLQKLYKQDQPQDLSQAKTEAKLALNKAYFYLNKEMWFCDSMQKKYFTVSDQVSIKVREKEALAFNKYYTVKWYMENLIEDEDSPENWAITQALEHTQEALKRLENAYEEMIDGFRDPLYSPRLTDNDREDIDDARENVAKAQNIITKAKSEWNLSQNDTSNYQSEIQALENKRDKTQDKVREAQDNFEQTKSQGQKLINQAQANLETAYQQAYKTISINTPQDTTALKQRMEEAQANYQATLNKSDTIELTSPQEGTIKEILVSEGSYLAFNQPVIKIGNGKSFEIKVTLTNELKNVVDIFDEVTVETATSNFPGIIKSIEENVTIIQPVKEELLQENETVKVSFKLEEKRNAIVAPKDYIIQKEDKDFVLTVYDNELTLQEVKTGIINGEYVEILEGVDEGDKIYLSK